MMRKRWRAGQDVMLLPSDEVDDLRRSNTLREAATGRSHCRACGQKIRKGEECLVSMYAFPGSHGWGSMVYVHVESCQVKGE